MRKLSSILVANRGEIACRIMRTAKRMGLRTIAVYSEADAHSLFVSLADEAWPIGPPPPRESYLVIDRIIEVARGAKADCIHPGYGFLSEKPEFAEACAAAGLVFVGPPASAIRAMGLKDAAKALVEKAGVPVVPGYHGRMQDQDFLLARAKEVGFPVLIKAVAGGGGKGMKLASRMEEFGTALASAKREALGAFGDERVLIEKYVGSPRHIEIQVFADAYGNAVHMFERDCSLQRRHQKVIEEAPAPGMPLAMREAMGTAAVNAAKAVGYVGAGTVEFIVDGNTGLRPDGFWFMEMNTRLQVEHPVTEAITGLDLVELQLRVAGGEALPFRQADLRIDGHAVEARLYAEDPERDFLPSTGRIEALRFPVGPGIRVDTGVRAGDEISPFYDPMIAKVIAHGATRVEALDCLAEALGQTLVAGPRTNIAFLKALAEAPAFREGRFDTHFIERHGESLGLGPQPVDNAAVLAGATALIARPSVGLSNDTDPWTISDGFQLLGRRAMGLPLLVDGARIDAKLVWGPAGCAVVLDDVTGPATDATVIEGPVGVLVVRQGRQTDVRRLDPFDVDLDHGEGGGQVKAPMHGKVVAVYVAVGDAVSKGQQLAIVEAMKMEHILTAPIAGVIASLATEADQQIAEGARVLTITPAGV